MRAEVRLAGSWIALMMVLVSASSVAAQRRPGPEKQPFRVESTIKAVRGNFMQVIVGTEEVWVVKIQAKPDAMSMSGKAEPSWLQRGMLVRFSARLNKRGQAQEPVAKLTVFTPREGYQLGAFLEQEFDAGQFDLDDEPKPKAGPADVANYLVAGQLTSIKNGAMTVSVGGGVVRAELAEDVEIDVDIADYRLARPGDKAKFEGYFYQKGQALATRVEVTATKPLKGPEPKKPVRPPRRPTRPVNKPEEGGAEESE